jgi:hypothetical protein
MHSHCFFGQHIDLTGGPFFLKKKRDRDPYKIGQEEDLFYKFPLLHAGKSKGRQELEGGRWKVGERKLKLNPSSVISKFRGRGHYHSRDNR